MRSHKASLAALPTWEIAVYWLLSFGSHFYSFYSLHRFSKGYEAGLGREFEFEKGFLIWGFKKDPTDFEWSFWSEWAKKCLIWTMLGHALVSKVSDFYIPKCRAAVLTVYGVLAAASLVGMRGVAVVVLHMSVSYAVALMKRPALSWTCSIALLSTFHMNALQEIQKSWYETESEYYLLLFCLAVSCLRYTSFSLEFCWQPLHKSHLTSLFWLSAYIFYHPLFFNGPIITFEEFSCQMQKPYTSTARLGARALFVSMMRIILWWCVAESMIHLMYMHAVQTNETYLKILPYWALGGLALGLVLFFYVKYLVLFGFPSLIVQLDGVTPPQLPRCVSIMYSFTGMWRHFDVGLYHWLIRYIYLPLGGSHHGLLRKVVSTALAFGFVSFWHGGHDYLMGWAVLNWMGIMAENGVKTILSIPLVFNFTERCFSAPMRRRGQAFLSAFCTASLILSNLVFLGGNHVARIFWTRIFVQGWPTAAVSVLAFLYCFAQIGMEWDRKRQ
ncbi:protein-cysteine N-palmitoyltransferase HHAT isoform X2 [Amia ocellicauda]|uniref:protein-cysteine N-palmitoyltransferase HHAT isoform X2 n=1 Tax=Amia ocellicauda TaxID=2972642 RepID=UPI003464CE9E